MPQVKVEYKYTSGSMTHYSTRSGLSVSRKPPTESEVLAKLKKDHPKYEDIIILKIE